MNHNFKKMTNTRPKTHRIAQYFAIRQILSFSISPNGRKIAYITNTNGLPNIWTIPIEGTDNPEEEVQYVREMSLSKFGQQV